MVSNYKDSRKWPGYTGLHRWDFLYQLATARAGARPHTETAEWL